MTVGCKRGKFEGKRGPRLSRRDNEESVSTCHGSDLCERQVAEKQLWSGSCVRLLLLTCQNGQACSQGCSVEVKPPRSRKSTAGTSSTYFGHA